MGHTARGSLRERRPGVWEIRIAAGAHPLTGRTVTRSVTIHGRRGDATSYAAELAAEQAARRSIARAAPFVTVDELLERWLAADHPWKPSTYRGYRSNARLLRSDPIGTVRVCTLTPSRVRAAMGRWHAQGLSDSVIGGRFRVLRAAIGWAYEERVIDVHPIRDMRGPRRPEPRRPLSDHDLGALLHVAETRLLEAVANDTHAPRAERRRHAAEQDLLLVRLAADTGARRGELAALRFDDLDGRVLHISRAISDNIITSPKSGHDRTLTIGASSTGDQERKLGLRYWRTCVGDNAPDDSMTRRVLGTPSATVGPLAQVRSAGPGSLTSSDQGLARGRAPLRLSPRLDRFELSPSSRYLVSLAERLRRTDVDPYAWMT